MTNTNELHLTAKDFKIEWFSGTGPGGQHRNKTQNCCRIIHQESGLSAIGTAHSSRVSNQRDAFNQLANRLVELFLEVQNTQMNKRQYRSDEVIRTYHAVRNIVTDKASGETMPYKEVVSKRDISKLLEARLKAMLLKTGEDQE